MTTTLTSADLSIYTAEIEAWRRDIEARLRSDNGWLTLTGLYWLNPGKNSLGSDPVSDVLLPDSAPEHLGYIDFADPVATLQITADGTIAADGKPTKTVVLRPDDDPHGETRIDVGSINFHLIKRGDQYGMRVRDIENPPRKQFVGRSWFPIDPAYRVIGTYHKHPQVRILDIETVAGVVTPTENPGYVEFTLDGHTCRFEAFSSKPDEVWFVFRDTSPQTYHTGRFLYAPLNVADGTVILDFNKAYNPPCAFTPLRDLPTAAA